MCVGFAVGKILMSSFLGKILLFSLHVKIVMLKFTGVMRSNKMKLDLMSIFMHQENMSVKCIPIYTPLLYSNNGVYISYLDCDTVLIRIGLARQF